MRVKLTRATDLEVCSDAIRQCHVTRDKKDRDWDTPKKVCPGREDRDLIERIGVKLKHSSTLEHLVYTFDIHGISRACLQELVRHRISSFTVKSTRYTLGELKKEPSFLGVYQGKHYYDRAGKYIVYTSNGDVNESSLYALEKVRRLKVAGTSNDQLKYCLPECYKTSLTWTVNARSLNNFLELRLGKDALWEIQQLGVKIFEALPESHQFLFQYADELDRISQEDFLGQQ